MPGTRTAPTVGSGTVTLNQFSLNLVDASGDTWSESLDAAGGAVLDMADIEAFAAAYVPTSNMSLWQVEQRVIWQGAKDPDNALALYRASAESGINLLFRDAATLAALTGRVVAPIATIMQGNQDIPLLVSPLTTLVTQYLNILAGTNLESMQWTGRRERRNNQRVAT